MVQKYRIKPIGDPVTYAYSIEQQNAAGDWEACGQDLLWGTFADSPAALAAIDRYRAETHEVAAVEVALPGGHGPIVQGAKTIPTNPDGSPLEIVNFVRIVHWTGSETVTLETWTGHEWRTSTIGDKRRWTNVRDLILDVEQNAAAIGREARFAKHIVRHSSTGAEFEGDLQNAANRPTTFFRIVRFKSTGFKDLTDCAVQQMDLDGNWWTIAPAHLLIWSTYENAENAIHAHAKSIGMTGRFAVDLPIDVKIKGAPEGWITRNQPTGKPAMEPKPTLPPDALARPAVTARAIMNSAGSWFIQRLDQGGWIWIGAPYDGYDERVKRIADEQSLRPTTFVDRKQAIAAISAFRGANGPDFDIAIEPTPVMFQIRRSPVNGDWFFFVYAAPAGADAWTLLDGSWLAPAYRPLTASFPSHAEAARAFGDWSCELAPDAVELLGWSEDDAVPAMLAGEDEATVAEIMNGAFSVHRSPVNGKFNAQRWRTATVGGHWSAVIEECAPELWPWRQFDTAAEVEAEIVKYGHRVGQTITIVRGDNEIASAAPGYSLPQRIRDQNGEDTGLIWKDDSPEMTAFAEQCRKLYGWKRGSLHVAALNTIVAALVKAGWTENTVYRGLQGLQPYADEPDGLTVQRLGAIVDIIRKVKVSDPSSLVQVTTAVAALENLAHDLHNTPTVYPEPDLEADAVDIRLDAVADVLLRMRCDSLLSTMPSAVSIIDEALAIARRKTPISDLEELNRYKDGRHAIASALSCLEALDYHLRQTGEGPNGGEARGNAIHRADAIYYLKRHPQHVADLAEQARDRQHALDCTMQADQPEQPPHANVAAHVTTEDPATGEITGHAYAASVEPPRPVYIETVTIPAGTNVPDYDGTFRIIPNLIEPAGGWTVQRWTESKGQWLTLRGENFPVSTTYWDAVELVAQASQRTGDMSRLAAPTDEQVERWTAKGFTLTAPPRAGDAIDVDQPGAEPSASAPFSIKYTVALGEGLYAVDEWTGAVTIRVEDDLTWSDVERIVHPDAAAPIGVDVGTCEIRESLNSGMTDAFDVLMWTGRDWKKIAGAVTRRTADGVVKARMMDPETKTPATPVVPTIATRVLKQWRTLMKGVKADLVLMQTEINKADDKTDPRKMLGDIREMIAITIDNLERAQRGE